MTIDYLQRVGIGTTTPGVKVDILSENNTSLASVLRVNSNNVAVNTSLAYDGLVGSGQLTVQAGASAALIFGSSATERARIDSSGNVGLGVTPSAWGTNRRAFQIGGNSSSALSLGATVGEIFYNSFFNTSSQLIAATTGQVGYHDFNNNVAGGFTWGTSNASVTAGNVATATTRMTITSGGNVGIGTTAPLASIEITGSSECMRIQSTTAANNYITHKHNSSGDIAYIGAAGGAALSSGAATDYAIRANQGALLFGTNGNNERARIDSSGRLLVGTSSARSNFFNTTITSNIVQIEGAGLNVSAGETITTYNAGTGSPFLALARSNSDTAGTNTLVTSGQSCGIISFQGNDGTEFVEGARIDAYVDGTPGANDMPGRLVFSTTADGAASPTERMRITNGGIVVVGNTSVFSITSSTATGSQLGNDGYILAYTSSQTAAYFGRQTSDGTIVEFRQDGTQEGSVSVSGTTVSYNGAHLSRWSQLPGGTERIEILRGTVLSNIDEMCGWGEEANEQLNRMKVSDVEGDKNVSGVFQAWDDDDDTYVDDFYCAMTGDFIIRIAEGVTVQRGDLLMSAGDGTAKPQDDDIIRSKTIAKVTSTHVTCTYEDGSYCVPCVLMAC
jgi:hypothetical protein